MQPYPVVLYLVQLHPVVGLSGLPLYRSRSVLPFVPDSVSFHREQSQRVNSIKNRHFLLQLRDGEDRVHRPCKPWTHLGLGNETASRKPCTADDIKHLFLYLLAPVSCGAAAVYTCREYPRIPGTANRLCTRVWKRVPMLPVRRHVKVTRA